MEEKHVTFDAETSTHKGKCLVRILVTGLHRGIIEKFASDFFLYDKPESGRPYVIRSSRPFTAAKAPSSPPEEEQPLGDAVDAGKDDENTRLQYSHQLLDNLQFGIVGAASSLGAWGRTDPLPLYVDEERSASEGQAVYVGRVTVPLEEMSSFLIHPSPTSTDDSHKGTSEKGNEVDQSGAQMKQMECRLVLLQRHMNLAVDELGENGHALQIVAVENAESRPQRLHIEQYDDPSHKYQLTLGEAAIPDMEEVQELLDVREVWRAEWNINRVIQFAPTVEQFTFLHTLPPLSPSMLRHKLMQYHTSDDMEQMQAILRQDKGPMVSLSFYASDPSVAFNKDNWMESLPTAAQAAMRELSIEQGYPATNIFEVKAVRPTPLEHVSWCDAHLPVNAPLKKRQEEMKRNKIASQSHQATFRGGESSYKSVKTMSESTKTSIRTLFGDTERGGLRWCVRPLRGILPPKPFTTPSATEKREPLASQKCWNTILHLAHLENQGIEVEIEVPVVTQSTDKQCSSQIKSANRTNNKGSTKSKLVWCQGKTVIVPSMFQNNTKGVLQIPVYCPSHTEGKKNSSGRWVVLYVQYLVVFPYNHDNNDLRIIRSVESFDRLSVPSLIGHRGLGKTYTRSRVKGQMAKLAENSIASFNAAYRRGCEMVEFDVMLTWDRVPIVIHDPILRLQAREKGENTVNKSITFEDTNKELQYPLPHSTSNLEDEQRRRNSFSSAEDFSGSDLGGRLGLTRSNSNDILYTKLQQFLAQQYNQYAPIAVPVHSLTKQQLDGIVTESFEFGSPPSRLKLLILRHWPRLLRIYRNRVRLQCLRDHSIVTRPLDEDEFHGCRAEDGGDPYFFSRYHHPNNPLMSSVAPFGSSGAVSNSGAASSIGSGSHANHPSYMDSGGNLLPYLDSYRAQTRRANQLLMRQVDITNNIPSLQELFLQVPPELGMNIEVKYPFQPKWDANLFLQTDAFEVNGFVDAVLDVVFAFSFQKREIVFSSFEPDICIALALKQSRYDVIFLSDTEEMSDLKDYRSFYISGAVQFASLQYLSGISISANSLCRNDQKHFPSTVIPPSVEKVYVQQLKKIMAKKVSASENVRSIPLLKELLSVMQNQYEKFLPSVGKDGDDRVNEETNGNAASATAGGEPSKHTTTSSPSLATTAENELEEQRQFELMWSEFDTQFGTTVVRESHRRHLKVFTWGEANVNHRFTCIEAAEMGVDGIITDSIPVVESNSSEASRV